MEKKWWKFRTTNQIKFICLISIFIQIKLQNIANENKFNTNHEIKNRDLLSTINITNYTMVRFIDYEFLDFNSIYIFKFFRKKYFNISYFKFDYDKVNNESKLEYGFELYDEDKNLFNLNNETKHFKIACITQTKKLNKKNIKIIDNKYYKCIEKFDISKPIKFGFQITKKKQFFSVFLNFNELFGTNTEN